MRTAAIDKLLYKRLEVKTRRRISAAATKTAIAISFGETSGMANTMIALDAIDAMALVDLIQTLAAEQGWKR